MKTTPFLAERLRRIMQLKQRTIARLAEEANISEDTIKSIRSGRTPNPGISVLVSLADALECSLDDLVGRSLYKQEETSLLQSYSMLSPRGKAMINFILDSELTPEPSASNRSLHCVLFHSYEAGTYIYEPDSPERISLPDNRVGQADFIIHIGTNLVSPYFFPGDYLAIRRRFPHHGEISAFTREGHAYLRRYEERDGKGYLLPLTIAKDAVPLACDDSFTCLGTFIGIMQLS